MRKVNLAYLYSILSLLHTCTHAVPCGTLRGKPYFSPGKYKFTHDETWALDLTMLNSLHDTTLSHGSMLYNPRERLQTKQVTIQSLWLVIT